MSQTLQASRLARPHHQHPERRQRQQNRHQSRRHPKRMNHLTHLYGRLACRRFGLECSDRPRKQCRQRQQLRRIAKMVVLYHLDLAKNFELQTLLDRLSSVGFETELMHQTRDRGWIFATNQSLPQPTT